MIVVPWFCFWNFAAISANASVSEAASATVMLPESFCCFAAATVALPPTPTSTVPAITQVATSRRIVPLRLIRMGGTVPGGARLWQPRAWPGPRGTMSLTDWTVLAVIVEEPRHGFSVARELAPDAPIGQVWTVRRPLVYRALEYLAVDGSIEASRTEPGTQGPHRTVYRATRAGRARLTRWLDEPVDHPRDVRAELLAKFVLRARRGDALTPLAQRQLELFAPVTDGLTRAARRAAAPTGSSPAGGSSRRARSPGRSRRSSPTRPAAPLDGAAVASLHASGAGADADD